MVISKTRTILISLALALNFLLSSCSSIQIAYNQADFLLKWWLDDYIDFTEEQEKFYAQAIPALLKKHRQEELPKALQKLRQLKPKLDRPLSEEEATLIVHELKTLSKESIYLTQDDLAKLALTLQVKQIQYLQNAFNKSNSKFQNDYLKGSADDRLGKRLEKIIERTEAFTGDLSKSQKSQLKDIAKEYLLDMQIVYQTRIFKQQLIISTLKKISSEQPTLPQVKILLNQLFTDIELGSTNEQKEFEKKRDLHSGIILSKTTELLDQSQRKKAQEKIKVWENDLQILISQKSK
jgi:hypothetical protein